MKACGSLLAALSGAFVPVFSDLLDDGQASGESKAAAHDFVGLLEKFHTARPRRRTLVFLQLDHIGGVNTLLYALANGGTVVVPAKSLPSSPSRTLP